MNEPLSIGMCAQTACILDVATYKPGNVNLYERFVDMTAVDFLLSAAAIGPILDQAPFRRVGDTILDCVRATRQVTTTNTNLGIVLLLAPLASVQSHVDLRGGLTRVLMRLDVADARTAYQAIRLAEPGGLGSVAEQDIANEPTVTLRESMALAADRDLVARQYVNDFEQVFEGAALLGEDLSSAELDFGVAVTRLFLRMLAKYPDSLIARKHGQEAAEEVSRSAQQVLEFRVRTKTEPHAYGRFGEWLRGNGDRPRNPGTTADIVTASLFVALRQRIIPIPLPRLPSSPLSG
jgi:triphosphoribosyl-dephospho-CoA synthase